MRRTGKEGNERERRERARRGSDTKARRNKME